MQFTKIFEKKERCKKTKRISFRNLRSWVWSCVPRCTQSELKKACFRKIMRFSFWYLYFRIILMFSRKTQVWIVHIIVTVHITYVKASPTHSRRTLDSLPYNTQTQRGIPWWILSLVPCNTNRGSLPSCYHGWRFFSSREILLELKSTQLFAMMSAASIFGPAIWPCAAGTSFHYDMYSLVQDRLSSAFNWILTRRLCVDVCQGTFRQL